MGITGTFAGLAEGATFSLTDTSTGAVIPFMISYIGGDGNDVVLTAVQPNVVYVDDNFANPTPGQDPNGGGPATIFGYDAFETIQEGVNAVAEGGMVIVNAGTYLEQVTINKSLTLDGETGIATDVTITPPAVPGGDGIIITSLADTVTLSDFQVTGAGDDGIDADVQMSLTVNNVRSVNNTGDGFEINTLGDVTLTDVIADTNLDRGVNVSGPGSSSFFELNEPRALTHMSGNTFLFVDNDGNLGTLTTGGVAQIFGLLDHNAKGLAFAGGNLFSVSPPDTSPMTIDDLLRTIDQTTGATLSSVTITLAGETVRGANGLATHPITGELYALLTLQGQTGRELVTINTTTGVATRIGNTGDNFAGLAFDSAGVLYGVTGEGANVPETLFTLDTATGAATQVLALGNGDDGETLAFNPNDGLFYHMSGISDIVFESINLAGPLVTDIPISVAFAPGPDVTITGGSFSGNAGAGIAIDNVINLTLTDVTANASQFGLDISRVGSVTVTGGSYSGSSITNMSITDVTGNVSLANTVVDNAQGSDGIILTGALSFSAVNTSFSGNDFAGLLLDNIPVGVFLTNVTANNNDANGFDLLNAGEVVVTGGSFSNNGSNGIFLDFVGPIAFTNVTANTNGDDGVQIDSAPTATFTSGDFSNNGEDGIDLLDVSGTISLMNVTANDSGEEGVQIANSGDINVNGGMFSDNAEDGLDFITVGQVTLTNVIASGNTDDGADIQDSVLVTVTGSSFSGNDEFGVELLNVDAASLTDATVDLNQFGGLFFENGTSLMIQGGSYSGNVGNGIGVLTASLVTVTGSTVSGNDTGLNLNTVSLGSIANSFVTGNGIGLLVNSGINSINQSDLSGNAVFIQNDSANIIDAQYNFFNLGIADDDTIFAGMTGTGPGVDFTPYLDNGDADTLTPGFQADLSVLNVTILGEQIGGGPRIQEGIDNVTVGGTVNVSDGTFLEAVTINKNLTLNGSGPSTILDAGTADGITILDGADIFTIQNLRITNATTGIVDASTATINSLSLANLLIDGSAQGGLLDGITTLNVTLTENNDIANVDSLQFNSTGLQSIAYLNVVTFNLSGDLGSDTFNVEPISTTNLTINGNDPTAPANPGDTLNYNGPGFVNFTATDSGTITQSGFNDVAFTGIETIVTDFVSETNGDFVVAAGADANDGDRDDFIFRINALGNLEVVVLDDFGNEMVVFTVVPLAVNSLRIVGSNDDDTLTVDFANGNPIPLGGLTFIGNGDGINDNDTLILQNGSAVAITHNFVNANNGSVVVDLTGGVPRTINYTGLEPIFDNLDAVDRTFNFAAANDAVTLSDDLDALGMITPNNTSRISSAATSETVEFFNPTGSLTINAGGGDDTITFQALESALSANLIVNGGSGRDTFDVERVTANAGITYTLNGDLGADTFNVASCGRRCNADHQRG